MLRACLSLSARDDLRFDDICLAKNDCRPNPRLRFRGKEIVNRGAWAAKRITKMLIELQQMW